MANAPRLPLVSALTCTVNRFEIPGLLSLGEALVLDPDGWAIAVWSASGVSQHGAMLPLAAELLRAFEASAGDTAGEAILSAYRTHQAAGGDPDPLAFFTLLGDPALVLPQPE